ncbi:MAG: hypothetical protein HY314_08900 [Acidobacteria bacterium]|nr:hypothetical protein [Acidobacteriota bacterium]
MKSELEKLIALQELDVKIREIEKEIANVPRQKAEIENQFNGFAADYLDKKNRLEATNKEHRQAEYELKELESKQEKYRQDLMRVKNEREYSAVLREIDVTKKIISALETQVLEKLELIEQLEKEIEALTPEIEVKRREFDIMIDEVSTKVHKLKADLDARRQHRAEVIKAIPADLLTRYNRLTQLRDGLPLAEVRDGSCTACFMTIRPQAYADVRKGESIITCDNCSRILYYKGAAPLQESQSAV